MSIVQDDEEQECPVCLGTGEIYDGETDKVKYCVCPEGVKAKKKDGDRPEETTK